MDHVKGHSRAGNDYLAFPLWALEAAVVHVKGRLVHIESRVPVAPLICFVHRIPPRSSLSNAPPKQLPVRL